MKRSSLILSLLTCFVLGACSNFLARRAGDIKQAVWVTRWDYRNEAQVRDIVRNCAEAGFDTVLFQVRGNGTVLYASAIEPWAEEFGHKHPGFDPLFVACDEAKRQGIQIQAWVNIVPGWRGDKPPATEQHVFHTRPEWFVVDQFGKRQALEKNGYIHLNPCLPAVRRHVASLCAEIAGRYAVDGIHLDYIRFDDPSSDNRDYPYDEPTLELYRQATGRTPDQDREAWRQWRMEQISATVREIDEAVARAKRSCLVTAAVYPTPEKARTVHQDWPTWLSKGWVDAVFPMTYDVNDARFADRIEAQRKAADGPVIVGIGAYKHSETGAPDQTLRQMRRVLEAGHQGFALFAYSSFFDSHRSAAIVNTTEASAGKDRRRKMRERVLPALQSRRILEDRSR